MRCFITFEGIDCTGKSTQCALLEEFLSERRGLPTLSTREPGGEALGEAIRNYILYGRTETTPEQDLILFSAARLVHLEQIILPALKQGKIVLCDRFIDSSWVYQVKEGGIDEAFSLQLEAIVCGDLKPDLTFILDLPPHEILARLTKRHKILGNIIEEERFETENIAKLEQRAHYFCERAAQDPSRYHIIDANSSPEIIATKIQQIVKNHLGI